MTYCLKRKQDTKNVEWEVLKTKNGRTMLSPKCTVCGNKKPGCMKEQEAKDALSSLGLKKPLKFMPEIHLKQPGFTYSVWGPFTKSKERIQNLMQAGNTDYIYKNDLDKVCFNMIWLKVNTNIWLK